MGSSGGFTSCAILGGGAAAAATKVIEICQATDDVDKNVLEGQLLQKLSDFVNLRPGVGYFNLPERGAYYIEET